MEAKPIINDKTVTDALIVQRVVWLLPAKTEERPHGLKYRLYCGTTEGVCIVRYDNEAGKGDHRHYGEREEIYTFTTLAALIQDFHADIARLTGEPKP
ncbi:MAG: DUF6516 family protein [Rudaea sp.]|uniref:toxin-antitoxin system TumE family protein n=1 Tax=Rudaea sp. TaxID=2136325 RepID=UPI0039E673D7